MNFFCQWTIPFLKGVNGLSRWCTFGLASINHSMLAIKVFIPTKMLIGISSFSLHANNSNHYYNIIVFKLNPICVNLEHYMNLKHSFHCIGRLIIILLNLIMVLYPSVTEVSLLLWLYIFFYIIHKTKHLLL